MRYFNCEALYELCPCLKDILIKRVSLQTLDGIMYEVEDISRVTVPGSRYASKINAFWRYIIKIKTDKTKNGYYPLEMFGFRLGMILYRSIQVGSGNMGYCKDDDTKMYLPTLRLCYDDVDPFKYEQMSQKEKEQNLRERKAKSDIDGRYNIKQKYTKKHTSGN